MEMELGEGELAYETHLLKRSLLKGTEFEIE